MKFNRVLSFITRGHNKFKLFEPMEKALIENGIKIEYLSPKYFDPKQDKDRNFDFVVVWGGLGIRRNITETFKLFGIKTLIFENAYSMKHNYIRITVDNPVGVYPFNVEKERLNFELNLDQKDKDYILLIGQGIIERQRLENIVPKLKELNKKIYFKPHPHWENLNIKDVEKIKGDTKELIKNAYCVVTDSSNCGNLALSLNTPVVCINPSSSFYNLSFKLDELEKIKRKTTITEELKQYFKRLSYTDWSIEEISKLEFMKYYQKWLEVDFCDFKEEKEIAKEKIELENLTVKELKEIANNKEIQFDSKITKNKLIELLKD